jgi:hypothetical protein
MEFDRYHPERHGPWGLVITDELEKVHPDRQPTERAALRRSVFLGEALSFQLAFRPPQSGGFRDIRELTLKLSGEVAAQTQVSEVRLVPVEFPAFSETDEGYDRVGAGLYPDLLVPLRTPHLQPVLGSWKAAWFDVTITDPDLAGAQTLRVRLVDADGIELLDASIEFDVIPAELPELDIVNAHWFHADSLADHYGLEVFSEEHWEVMDRFLAKAAEMNVNSVLTPVWTPPLDTGVGTYRTPVQLVDIELIGPDQYRFAFDKLDRWMEMCRSHGIRGLEIAHLFTQWGAEHPPAVYARRARTLEVERIFGWDTPATGKPWRRFLEQLLPELQRRLEASWDRDRVIFHVSDEPHGESARTTYVAARGVVDDLLDGWLVVDAVYDEEFLESGFVPLPIIATNVVEDHLDRRAGELWVYYCQGQNLGVSNRFIAMPSVRNRAIGHQLFARGVSGFLHWGFNFYYSWHAKRLVNPLLDTCAGGTLPGGDAFIVYPGDGGVPWESIRFRVFLQAMFDHRAMQAARALRGETAVRQIIDPEGTLAFDSFSYRPGHYIETREHLNALIAGGSLLASAGGEDWMMAS